MTNAKIVSTQVFTCVLLLNHVVTMICMRKENNLKEYYYAINKTERC